MTPDEVLRRLIDVFPRFEERWIEMRVEYEGPLPYAEAGALAHAAARALRDGESADVARLFAAIESLLLTRDEEATRLIALGFVDALQHDLVRSTLDPDAPAALLGDEGRRAWDARREAIYGSDVRTLAEARSLTTRDA